MSQIKYESLEDNRDYFFSRTIQRIVFALFLSAVVLVTSGRSQTVGDIYTFVNTAPLTANLQASGAVAFDKTNNMYVCLGGFGVFKVTPQGVSSRYAGGGTLHGSGSPTSVENYDCNALAFDQSGNLYIADDGIVWIVNPSDTYMSIFAGGGQQNPCFTNGIMATSAIIGSVEGLAVDTSGNVFMSVSPAPSCSRVYEVTAGQISTYAGGTTQGYCGDNGLATSACLYEPQGLALDAWGNLYIADESNFRVRVVVKATGYIYTYAGTGSVSYIGQGSGAANQVAIGAVMDVKFDPYGDLFLSDYSDNVIREVVPSGSVGGIPAGTLSTYAGTGYGAVGASYCNENNYVASQDGGSALQANLSCPGYVATDSSGNVYIADSWAYRVREVIAPLPPACLTTGNICTVAGNGVATFAGEGVPALTASLNNPLGLYVDGSSPAKIFVADAYNNRVREFTVGGDISTIAGNGQGGIGVGDAGDGGLATSAITNTPGAITEDGAGNLDILDMFSNGISFPVPDADTYSDIRVVSLTTNQISNLLDNACNAGSCNGTNPYTFPAYANDFALGQYADPNSGNIYSSYYLPFYASSDMSVLDADGSQFWYDISPGNPVAVAVDNTNNVEYFSNAPLSFDGGPFAQTYQYQVMMIDANGNVTPIAGVGSSCTTYDPTQDGYPAIDACMTPGALAVDAAGDVFIADPVANVVRVVVSPLDTTRANARDIYTIAGDAALGAGFSGDRGAATSAQLNSPGGLKVDSSGNLYISDTKNNRVRMVTGAVSLIPHNIGMLPGQGCTPSPHHPCAGG